MPYYHAKDDGEIKFWQRKCKVCGERWPLSALWALKVPEGMTIYRPGFKVGIKKGKASYAKWGDRYPGVATVASHLPNWPRWLRIVSFSCFMVAVIVVMTLNIWSYIAGLIILAVISLAIVAFIIRGFFTWKS